MDPLPQTRPARKKPAPPRLPYGMLALLCGLAVAIIATGVIINAAEDAAPVAAPPSPTPTAKPYTAPTVAYPPPAVVSISCGSWSVSLMIHEKLDFTGIWRAESDHCQAERPASVPLTELESEAFAKSGYSDPAAVRTLYAVCAKAAPDGYFTSGDHTASAAQAAELRGALVLCPDHPYADRLKAAAEAGERDAELEKDGRLFGEGTFLVGEEIKPGTYVVTGDIEGCYWERQSRDGDIIDNYFSLHTRRVVVTIRASDYAFSSQDCGRWRPA